MPSNLKVKARRRRRAIKTYFVKSARAKASLILQPPENSLQEKAVVATPSFTSIICFKQQVYRLVLGVWRNWDGVTGEWRENILP